jgi:hypothetical protein
MRRDYQKVIKQEFSRACYLPQTPDAQMARQIPRGAAFHAFIIAGSDEAGEALATLRDRSVYHGPEFGL